MTSTPPPGDARLLDLRGLRCPLPVLRLRKALAAARPDERLTVITDDPLAAIDVPNYVRESGDSLLGAERQGGAMTFHIRRSARAADPGPESDAPA